MDGHRARKAPTESRLQANSPLPPPSETPADRASDEPKVALSGRFAHRNARPTPCDEPTVPYPGGSLIAGIREVVHRLGVRSVLAIARPGLGCDSTWGCRSGAGGPRNCNVRPGSSLPAIGLVAVQLRLLRHAGGRVDPRRHARPAHRTPRDGHGARLPGEPGDQLRPGRPRIRPDVARGRADRVLRPAVPVRLRRRARRRRSRSA